VKTKWENVKTPIHKMLDEMGTSEDELAEAIEAVPMVRARRKVAIERETLRAQAVRESAIPIQQQIAARKAAASEKAEKENLERKASLDSTRAEDEAKVKAQIEKAQQKTIADAEREKNRKVELKAWNKQSKAREAKRKQEGVEEAKRKEASRVSKIEAIIGRVNLILSDADVLYADLKYFRDSERADQYKRANKAEQEQIKKALDAASVRCTNAKRLLER
jgi:hypothetical protein